MNLSEKQSSRLERFGAVVAGRYADDPDEQRAHREAANRFEIFLLARDFAFSEQSFRTYLIDLHTAGKMDADARAAEQQRLRLYFHTFAAELEPDAPPPEAPRQPEEKPEPPREAATSLGDLPGAADFACPACGFAQERGTECISCGIVFAKWQARHPGAGTATLGALGAQAGRTVGSWRRAEKRSGGGWWLIFFYVLAPSLLLTTYAVVDRANTRQREEIVHLQRELTFTGTEIEEIDTPPTERIVCHLPGTVRGNQRPAAPFFLRAPRHMNLAPGKQAAFEVGLQPRAVWHTDFQAESVMATLSRTWIDKNIGTQGMEQRETLWSARELFKKDLDPAGTKRSAYLEPGSARTVWRYAVPVERVVSEPGDYHLKLTIVGWYPDPNPRMLTLYTWRKRVFTCEEAVIHVNSFEETEALRAALQARKQKLESELSALGTSERLSRIGRYTLLLMLFGLSGLVFYAAFLKPREE